MHRKKSKTQKNWAGNMKVREELNYEAQTVE